MTNQQTPYLPLPALTTRLQSYSALIETGYKFEKAPDQLFIRELIKYTNTPKSDPAVVMFVQKIIEKIISLDDAQWLGHMINIGLNPNMTLTNAHKELKGLTNIVGLAAVENATNCAQELVNRKADMNGYEALRQINPLLYATQHGKKDMARILLQSNIRREFDPKTGDSLTQIALKLKSNEGDAIFKALIKSLKPSADSSVLDHTNAQGKDVFTDCLILGRADAAELVVSKTHNYTQAQRIIERAQSAVGLWRDNRAGQPELVESLNKALYKLQQKASILLEKQDLQTEVNCVMVDSPQKSMANF